LHKNALPYEVSCHNGKYGKNAQELEVALSVVFHRSMNVFRAKRFSFSYVLVQVYQNTRKTVTRTGTEGCAGKGRDVGFGGKFCYNPIKLICKERQME
jgi:hypothetical protein